jgi:hypothetical protein
VDELFASPSEAWERVPEVAGPVLERHWSRVRGILARRSDAPTSALWIDDKRSALQQLQSIGEDRFKNLELFRAIIAEDLENTQADLHRIRWQLRQENRKLRQDNRKLRQHNREVSQQTAKLTRWLGEVDGAMSALLKSRQWKTARLIAKIYRTARRRPMEAEVEEHLKAVLKQFRVWREEVRSKSEDRKENG